VDPCWAQKWNPPREEELRLEKSEENQLRTGNPTRGTSESTHRGIITLREEPASKTASGLYPRLRVAA